MHVCVYIFISILGVLHISSFVIKLLKHSFNTEGNFTPIRMVIIKKMMTNVGNDVEKLNSLYTGSKLFTNIVTDETLRYCFTLD